MKIVRIATAYNLYINKFYSKNSAPLFCDYNLQKKHLDYDSFGWADFWKVALKKYGYDVTEITANNEPLQKAWARENKVSFCNKSWITDITRAQIMKTKPEILFVDDTHAFNGRWIKEIKSECKSIKLVFGHCGAPFKNLSIFREYDFVLSCCPEIVQELRKNGIKSEHINHAFEKRILKRIPNTGEKGIDISFVGNIFRTTKLHEERYQLLSKISRRIDIDIFSPSFEDGHEDKIVYYIAKQRLINFPFIKNSGLLEKMTLPAYNSSELFAKSKVFIPVGRAYAGVYGLDMFKVLSDSKITVNNHIGIATSAASNMRLYEATGMGACLVTDYKNNINSLFEDGKEIVTYKSHEECVEKIKWLLDNPEKAEEIGLASQRRTLKEHTFDNRAEELDGIIKRFNV